MDDAFWNIIEIASRSAVNDSLRIEDALSRDLMKRPPQEIEQFQQTLKSKLDTAYTWELWGAAYLINGGCSDDGFEYFRCWLITRGRAIFESAVANPDSLADLVSADDDEEGRECEALLYVVLKAYETTTGSKMPRSPQRPSRKVQGT